MNKSSKIYILLPLIAFCFSIKYLIQWLSIELHFVQNENDFQFEKKLYDSLHPYSPIKVSEIHNGNWNKVCILYVYGRPDRDTKQYAAQLEENFYLSRKWEFPPFLEKFTEGVWWMFFVNEQEIVTELYRMNISVGPDFYEENGYEKEIPKYFKHIDLNRFRAVEFKESCTSVESAYFMQNHDGYLYNKGKAFVLLAERK